MELTRDIGKGTPEKGTEMATTQVGQIEYQVPSEFYGDFVEDFDTEAVNAALLARLNEQMPKGVGVAANGMVFAELPLTVSAEEIVAAIAVAMEDIDVNEIIGECAAARPSVAARRCDMSGYVLWGYHPDYCGGEPIKLAGSSFLGSLRSESSWRKGGGWTTAIYRSGAEPKGLLVQAEVARR